MTRCSSCQRWWSVGPGEPFVSACCGAELRAIDMKAFIQTLPDGTKVTHNHLTRDRKPEGACPACDHDRLAEQKARAEAKQSKEPPKP